MLNIPEQVERATRGPRLSGALEQMESVSKALEVHSRTGMTVIERIARESERTMKTLEAISRPAITGLAEEMAQRERQGRELFEAATLRSTALADEFLRRERQTQDLIESATRRASAVETALLTRQRGIDASIQKALTFPRIELPDMGWVDRALGQATTIASQVESWMGRTGFALERSWKEASRWAENLGGVAPIIERAWEHVRAPSHDWKSLLREASSSVLSMGFCDSTNDDIASDAVASLLTAYPEKLKTDSPEEVRRLLRAAAKNNGRQHARSRSKRREVSYEPSPGKAPEACIIVSAREQASLFMSWAGRVSPSGRDVAYLYLLGEAQEDIADYFGVSRGKLRASILDAMKAELARLLASLSEAERIEFIRVIRAEAERHDAHLQE